VELQRYGEKRRSVLNRDELSPWIIGLLIMLKKTDALDCSSAAGWLNSVGLAHQRLARWAE
jgi:hypothetical protein